MPWLKCRCGMVFMPARNHMLYVSYSEQPEFNHAYTLCVSCRAPFFLFDDVGDFKPEDHGLKKAKLNHAPPDVKAAKEVYELSRQNPDEGDTEEFEPVKIEDELTPRMEQEIAALGVALAETPDVLLMDLFSQPPPKSKRPARWR